MQSPGRLPSSGVHGIRVSTISPGPIAGTIGMEKPSSDGKFEDAITANVPLKRCGTILDIEHATTLYLASLHPMLVVLCWLWMVGFGWQGVGLVKMNRNREENCDVVLPDL
ncbi:hypothetical protein BJ742DRAFT_837395 [Cladochytrium replicatum]|nr:hypothetical protein BJ742DRAFT_837395 [Cladochytrium replicatum]